MILDIIKTIFPLLEKAIPDPNERERIQRDITLAVVDNEKEYTKAIASIVTTEASGDSWMQKNWRPSFSFLLIFMWGWSFFLRPLTNAALGVDIEAVPPDELTFLTSIWAGAYGIGRSFEKTGSSIKIGGSNG